MFDALGASCQVAAGTAWLWARPEALGTVDVMLTDEAAQMSLAAEPQDVVLGQAESADGRFIIDAGVWPVPVVSV